MSDLYRRVNKLEKLTAELKLVKDLAEEGLNKTEIGLRLGKSLTWVTAKLNLIKQQNRLRK